VAVDHVLPWVLMTSQWHDGDLRQVWNLVLACYRCNSAKGARPPAADWMPWLDQRGEHLIASHHPLRETLISQLGPDPAHRYQTLARRHTAATEMIPPRSPPDARIAVSQCNAKSSLRRRTSATRPARRTTTHPEDN